MKILVVYYSRTGRTEAVASKVAEAVGAQRVMKLETEAKRAGVGGAFKSIRDIMSGRDADIKAYAPVELGEYDLVIVGTPVWAGTCASPAATFLKRNKGIKRAAYIVTCGSASGAGKVMQDLDNLCGVAGEPQMLLAKSSGSGDTETEDFIGRVKALEQTV